MTELADGPPERQAPITLRPDADRTAAEEAKFAELRSLLVGPERREVGDLKAHLADQHARALEVSDVLPDAIAYSAKGPQLALALTPAIEQAIQQSVRDDPQPLTDALLPVVSRAMRKSMAQTLTPLITLGCAVLLAGGVWGFQTYRAWQQWNGYIQRLSSHPGIVVIQSGRRDGTFFVTGLRDEMAIDPATLLAASGLTPAAVESHWEPYQALHPAFVVERARAVLQPPAGVTLAYRDGILTADGAAAAQWIAESQRIAPAIAGVRRFEHRGGTLEPEPKPQVEATPVEPAPEPERKASTPSPTNTAVAPAVKPWVETRPMVGSAEMILIEQIEATTLLFADEQPEIAPGERVTVRQLANLLRELNEIVYGRDIRAEIEIIAYTVDGSDVAGRQRARARAGTVRALLAPYRFDALGFTTRTAASTSSPLQRVSEAQKERTRLVSFNVRLFESPPLPKRP